MYTLDELTTYNTTIRDRWRQQKDGIFRWGKPYYGSFNEMYNKAINENYNLMRITSTKSYYFAKIPENSYNLIKCELQQNVIDKKLLDSKTYLFKWNKKTVLIIKPKS
jgi:hypothetical protein